MSNPLAALATLPSGVKETAEIIARLDQCFVTGFGRMSEREISAISALPRLLEKTPIGTHVREACDALLRSEFVEKHFAALACARAALQGAMADTLSRQVQTVLQRNPDADEPSLQQNPVEAHHTVFRESTRHFLLELALTGFAQLETDSIYPFYATLDKIQEEPALIRLSATLGGFLSELLSALPIPTGKSIPVYRWVDLWTRAMLLSLTSSHTSQVEKISGEFVPFGTVLHHHRNLFSVCLHGLLNTGKTQEYVRATVSAYKVDTVIGHEMWRLLEGKYDKFLSGIRDCAALKITNMPFQTSGDFLWDESCVSVGKTCNPLEVAQAVLAGGKPFGSGKKMGLDRHPAMLAEPVFLTSYKTAKHETHKSKRASVAETIQEQALDFGSAKIPLSGAHLSEYSGITLDQINKSSAMIALLRFDRGRWCVQPLALRQGNKNELGGTPPISAKSKDDTVAVLRERASKLLRKKS